MASVTELENSTETVPGTEVSIRLTTTGTTSTYVCPYFSSIESVIANNESDNDGVGIGVSGQTITITVGTSGDVVGLKIDGLL